MRKFTLKRLLVSRMRTSGISKINDKNHVIFKEIGNDPSHQNQCSFHERFLLCMRDMSLSKTIRWLILQTLKRDN